MILPPDIIATIKAFGGESAKQKRLLAFSLLTFFDEVPHGKHAELYDMIADEWSAVTGEYVTGRTVRYWVQSVKAYTKDELKHYHLLTDAQLVEAVKLANDCQNGATPQQILEWCVSKGVDTVSAMRAEWLPPTGTPEHVDPPALSGIIRLFGRLFKANHPKRKRIDEIIAELRGYCTEKL